MPKTRSVTRRRVRSFRAPHPRRQHVRRPHGPDTGEELFLNNALLEAGHAVPKKSWEFGDWEKDLTG